MAEKKLCYKDEVLNDKGLMEIHRYDDYLKVRNYLKSLPTYTEEDIVNDYCKSRCMTLITDDALEEFLKINSKLSDKQKLAIKAMMFVFDKWSDCYVGSTYLENRHNITDDNSIDFGEAYNICSKLIKGEE